MASRPLVCVIDTNVVVAGLLTANANSPTAQTLDGMLGGKFMYLMSQPLLSEYATVLRRRKIAELHQMRDEQVDALLTEIVANAIWREPDSAEEAPEPGDNHLWSLLASHLGSILVTGDQLLVNNPPNGHSVISARGFIDEYLPQAR